jgi:cytosine/uracil/thiamine/allantoin permease
LGAYAIVSFLLFWAVQRYDFWTALPTLKKAAVVIAGEAVFAIAALALWRKRKFVSIGILLFVLVDIIVSTFGY